ncbi:MAG TPA: hypothetical protein PLC42_03030, partial [Parachlamydiaceae bacterium]|nr:hypothetical protein [Parachlamydiaceae bacterium]
MPFKNSGKLPAFLLSLIPFFMLIFMKQEIFNAH